MVTELLRDDAVDLTVLIGRGKSRDSKCCAAIGRDKSWSLLGRVELSRDDREPKRCPGIGLDKSCSLIGGELSCDRRLNLWLVIGS